LDREDAEEAKRERGKTRSQKHLDYHGKAFILQRVRYQGDCAVPLLFMMNQERQSCEIRVLEEASSCIAIP
jgi:hypothetical protein